MSAGLRILIVFFASISLYGQTLSGLASTDRASTRNEKPFVFDPDLATKQDLAQVLRDVFSPSGQNVRSCTEKAGTGICGGYNSDLKIDCPCYARPVTYRCTDGGTVQKCDRDQYCADTNCTK